MRFHQTSGTTGAPLRVFDTHESWDWWGRCWAHVLTGAGMGPSDRLFMAFAFGPFVGFWAAVEGARKIGALMIPGGGRDSAQRLELMRDLGATGLCCTPTYALRLGEVAREAGFDLRSIPMRATIHAGASEVGAHSFECSVQPGGTHLIESEFIAEVLDTATDAPTTW